VAQDLTARGFWLTGGWLASHSAEEKREMLDELYGLVRRGLLKARVERVPLRDGLACFAPGAPSGKKLLVMDEGAGL